MSLKTNIHLILNPGYNASRVMKETRGLIEGGYFDSIVIVAVDDKKIFNNTEVEVGLNRKLIRLGSIKNITNNFYLKRILKIFSLPGLCLKYIWLCNRYRPAFLNVHTVFLLPMGSLLKFLFKCKLIYDAHELETEVTGLSRGKKKRLKLIERLFIRYADEVVVVGSRIAEWYCMAYQINNVHVVRNFPYKQAVEKRSGESLLRKEFDIPDESLLFIYNGLLSSGRGIELTLEVFRKPGRQHHIVFMGYGPLVALVQEYESKYSNVHYKKAVPHSEVIKYTSGADVGITIIENTCLSYYYSMPNKLFEYIQAGIPSIVSNFPEMGTIVKKYECGWLIEPDAQALRECINIISKKEIDEKSSKMALARADLCWENELPQFKEIYKSN